MDNLIIVALICCLFAGYFSFRTIIDDKYHLLTCIFSTITATLCFLVDAFWWVVTIWTFNSLLAWATYFELGKSSDE